MTLEARMDQPNPFVPGQVVRSKAGHDKGSVFLVLDIVDAKHVLVVDGRKRPVERPKKKRMIHLQPYRSVLSDVGTMKANNALDNEAVQSLLAPFTGADI